MRAPNSLSLSAVCGTLATCQGSCVEWPLFNLSTDQLPAVMSPPSNSTLLASTELVQATDWGLNTKNVVSEVWDEPYVETLFRYHDSKTKLKLWFYSRPNYDDWRHVTGRRLFWKNRGLVGWYLRQDRDWNQNDVPTVWQDKVDRSLTNLRLNTDLAVVTDTRFSCGSGNTWSGEPSIREFVIKLIEIITDWNTKRYGTLNAPAFSSSSALIAAVTECNVYYRVQLQYSGHALKMGSNRFLPLYQLVGWENGAKRVLTSVNHNDGMFWSDYQTGHGELQYRGHAGLALFTFTPNIDQPPPPTPITRTCPADSAFGCHIVCGHPIFVAAGARVRGFVGDRCFMRVLTSSDCITQQTYYCLWMSGCILLCPPGPEATDMVYTQRIDKCIDSGGCHMRQK